ncbi:MAG: glycosyltransferase family 4 protein [Oligoflexales bacterium]|nr:glycosyltransferase family 4 protein [Oligoflexales bacterium]
MIIVSQYGGFHGRYGAEASNKIDKLQSFITNFPGNVELPKSKILDLSFRYDLVPRGLNKLSRTIKSSYLKKISSDFRTYSKKCFDEIVASNITEETKVVHAYSAFQEHTWKNCKRVDAFKIIDWGIAHPTYLQEILTQERLEYGHKANSIESVSRSIDELYQADKVLIPSDFVAQTFIENGFPINKIEINPYGVDIGIFTPKIKYETEKLRIGMAGALSIRKGIRYLLEAISKIKREGIPFKLTLFGSYDVDTYPVISKYRDLIDEIKVVNHLELPNHYKELDVFVLPSLAEGMSRAISEAMSCGLPCIVTPNCGYGEFINDYINGFQVPIKDSDAIAEKLQYLFENPEKMKEMGENAANDVKKISWGSYKQRLQKIYTNLLN